MALSMYVPALHALVQEGFREARAFFYAGTLGLFTVSVITITLSGRPRQSRGGLTDLAALLAGFTVLPLFLALPLYEGLRTTSYLNAYVEMVSSLTTTGATLFDAERLSGSMHLWRAQVGWFGGLIMWISAAAILAPLSLGGFEVTASAEPGRGDTPLERYEVTQANRRLQRSARQLTPVYVGLTAVLWFCLVIAGERPLDGAIHAMSTLATSGITALNSSLAGGQAGYAGEVLVFLFLFFGLSRLTFSSDTLTSARQGLHHDPEFRIGLLLVAGVPMLLMLRHWLAAYDVDAVENLAAAAHALWGAVFTVMSFLTTTGFESDSWQAARNWSGLNTPGMILMGLAMMGGGVATTAGGVKLLRVYALYLNGLREMDRLVHPSSVGRAAGHGRRIRRKGAFVAWVFFMLFALTLALVSAVLAYLGVGFENAVVLAVAALSTTGPLVAAAADTPIFLVEMGAAGKLVFSAAMVLGRLELLAIIALINPVLWRD
ncbi:potassium transporter TrkG [Alisedimentitalea sp. MJ-SS2]|uniref:TrkH family potassium uptake protein n=1 Tax=Aliisedimentitalea sp. MJ-SS2 TaxID=3049795 RepID=UPI002906E1A9|nr:potassium transporter TrkG [Alisedimentitalea sp. MJ-SS2]MDU8929713.1 potassium transporter TrkG [Alisedimentitalea sp. MJ-SS2]